MSDNGFCATRTNGPILKQSLCPRPRAFSDSASFVELTYKQNGSEVKILKSTLLYTKLNRFKNEYRTKIFTILLTNNVSVYLKDHH